jgi:hypothetical protein
VRIPIIAAISLLSLIADNDDPEITRSIKRKLSELDSDMRIIEEFIIQLSQIQNALFVEDPNIKDWPGLSGEFAALLSWLMQDLKTSKSSLLFDSNLHRLNLERLDSLGVKGPYPPELKIKVHHWVVGACWTESADRASALVFPLRNFSIDREQSGIAYNGLVRHMQTLEALGLDDDPGTNSEMAVSSIALRVVGLAEALNPEIEGNARVALDNQLGSKFGGGPNTEVKKDVAKEWNLEELMKVRNSIAHVTSRETDTFSKTIETLSGEKIHKLSKLASTLMASEILYRLESVSKAKVMQWLVQLNRQLEDQNLNRLENSRASQFKDQLDTKYQSYLKTGLPSQLVTPLG